MTQQSPKCFMRMHLRRCEVIVEWVLVRKMSMTIRTYSELITLPTFEERFRYLRLDGEVGKETFGFDRYLKQKNGYRLEIM